MQNRATWTFGWVLAAALAGVVLAGGFQDGAGKYGIVDFAGIVEKSDYFKAEDAKLNAMKTAREGLLQFLFENKCATTEQATRLRDLTVKENVTAPEKQEMDKIKADVQANEKKFKDLGTKPNLTPDETALVRELAGRRQTIEDILPRWQQEFERELQGKFAQVRQSAIDRAKASLAEVAKAGGYSVIFRSDVAPYGANDVSDAALKSMNAKK